MRLFSYTALVSCVGALALASALSFTSPVFAEPRIVSFAGTTTVSFAGCPEPCEPFGLGVRTGTPFAGTASYDPVTQEVFSLSVTFPHVTLTASELVLQLPDPTFGPDFRFNLGGRIASGPGFGLFLNLNLIDFSRTADATQPLRCEDWDVCQLVIAIFEGAPDVPPHERALWAATTDTMTNFSFLTPPTPCPVLTKPKHHPLPIPLPPLRGILRHR